MPHESSRTITLYIYWIKAETRALIEDANSDQAGQSSAQKRKASEMLLKRHTGENGLQRKSGEPEGLHFQKHTLDVRLEIEAERFRTWEEVVDLFTRESTIVVNMSVDIQMDVSRLPPVRRSQTVAKVMKPRDALMAKLFHLRLNSSGFGLSKIPCVLDDRKMRSRNGAPRPKSRHGGSRQ